MYQRRHFRRIVIAQECVGNVLDLNPRLIGQAEGPEVDVDRAGVSTGGTTPRRRTHVMAIPILDDQIVRLAEMMAEMSTMYGHQVRLYALSGGVDAAHMVWAEPSSMEVIPSPAGLRDIAPQSIRIETRVYHAAIAEGQNLLAGVPWEGTSTPGSPSDAYGIASIEGGIAVSDATNDTIYIYDEWGGEVLRRYDSPATSTRDLTYYGARDELHVVSEAEQRAFIVDPADGAPLGDYPTYDDSGTTFNPRGVTVARRPLVGEDAIFIVDDVGKVWAYNEVPNGETIQAGGYQVGTNIYQMSSDGMSLAPAPGDDEILMVGGSDLTTPIEFESLNEDTSATVTTTSKGYEPERGIGNLGADLVDVAPDGTSRRYDGVTSTVASTSDLGGPQPLRVRGPDGRPQRGYFGPTWQAEHAVSIGIDGVPDVVSSSEPLILELPFPFGGAEVQLQGCTGALDGYAFSGTALTIDDSSRIGTPPQVLLEGGKYAGLGINALTVWGVRCRVEDVASRPQLVVVSPGTPRGALRGAYSQACVASPAWAGAAVNSISFDWVADAGDQLSIDVTEAPGVNSYIGAISGEGEAVEGTSAGFEADEAGTYTAEMVSESFGGITEFRSQDNTASPHLGGALEKFENLIGVYVGSSNATGTLTEGDLNGVEILDWVGSFQEENNGSLDIPVQNLSSSIKEMKGKSSGVGASGDWAQVSSGAYPDLFRIRCSFDGTSVQGSLGDLLSAAPSLENHEESGGAWWGVDSPVTDLRESDGSLSYFRVYNTGAASLVGVFADFDDPQVPDALEHVYQSNSELGGELGNLPSQTLGFSGTVGGGSNGAVTVDTYSPSNFDDFSTLEVKTWDLDAAYDTGDALAARAANGASSANAYPSGYTLIITGGDRNKNSLQEKYLDHWVPPQHPFRALGVKPNISWSLGGTIDTSGWNSGWAVAGGVSYPSASEITVDRPTSDGASDTQTNDGSAIPTDTTLPSANGGSGALLHIFEDEPNATGPLKQANPPTDYIVEGVTDNADGTITFTLDTSNGPSLSDTSSTDLDANTRIAITW